MSYLLPFSSDTFTSMIVSFAKNVSLRLNGERISTEVTSGSPAFSSTALMNAFVMFVFFGEESRYRAQMSLIGLMCARIYSGEKLEIAFISVLPCEKSGEEKSSLYL